MGSTNILDATYTEIYLVAFYEEVLLQVLDTRSINNYAFGFCSFIFGTIYQWLVAPDAVDLPKQFEAFRRSTAKAFGIPY